MAQHKQILPNGIEVYFLKVGGPNPMWISSYGFVHMLGFDSLSSALGDLRFDCIRRYDELTSSPGSIPPHVEFTDWCGIVYMLTHSPNITEGRIRNDIMFELAEASINFDPVHDLSNILNNLSV